MVFLKKWPTMHYSPACCVQLQIVAKGIDGEAFSRAFVVLQLLQVRDWQSHHVDGVAGLHLN
jgi:hypothetical protein